ncbi:TPA: RNA-binding protein [Patescibacteria group bacterium]|uniref:RRM domain-containing RNA-binding protein n=1 Tax=Candidatus Gottesmanbacteria bacterium GW2011_GWA1_43_11 TaxID=1618436 RepID=A0A0G1FAE4_9BACT|nr:MAG: RRM domain-containing RNA-binding protein [Candidatus Gottesmanbacteria bacterium GW2011_GWA1_43_11]HCS79038.1 RNA-binding protein [Patescibacteria group bacterium]
MAKKLFIGCLPTNTTEQTLNELFVPFGQIVSLTIIKDERTRMSRGFGFVEMATEEGARQAAEKLNGFKINDRLLVVKEALAKTQYRGMNDNRFNNRRFRRF